MEIKEKDCQITYLQDGRMMILVCIKIPTLEPHKDEIHALGITRVNSSDTEKNYAIEWLNTKLKKTISSLKFDYRGVKFFNIDPERKGEIKIIKPLK